MASGDTMYTDTHYFFAIMQVFDWTLAKCPVKHVSYVILVLADKTDLSGLCALGFFSTNSSRK